MSSTFMTSFCRAANFRALIQDPSAASLGTIKSLADSVYSTRTKTKLEQSDLIITEGNETDEAYLYDRKKLVALGSDDYIALSNFYKAQHDCKVKVKRSDAYVHVIDHCQRGQERFASAKPDRPNGNSMVLYKESGPNGKFRAGRVDEVYLHKLDKSPICLLKIQPYVELSPEEKTYDPFNFLGGELDLRLCHANKSCESIVIDKRSIISHFASHVARYDNIKGDCIAVLSLNRVRHPSRARCLHSYLPFF